MKIKKFNSSFFWRGEGDGSDDVIGEKKGRDVRIKESGICTSGSQELHHPVHLDNRMLLGGDAGQRREQTQGRTCLCFIARVSCHGFSSCLRLLSLRMS